MIDVVAGVIIKRNKILLARRKAGKSLAGYWEFPGGKIEKGEAREAALRRELAEEFSLDAQIGRFLGENIHDYGAQKIRLMAFLVAEFSGEIRLSDHDRIDWVEAERLSDYRLAPADIPLVKVICNHLDGQSGRQIL